VAGLAPTGPHGDGWRFDLHSHGDAIRSTYPAGVDRLALADRIVHDSRTHANFHGRPIPDGYV
jgi:hypothetical protein